jgi:hypothetical protein
MLAALLLCPDADRPQNRTETWIDSSFRASYPQISRVLWMAIFFIIFVSALLQRFISDAK